MYADRAVCNIQSGFVDRIERVLRLDGELNDHQHQRLLDIANRRPIHRTLQSQAVIETTLG